MSGARSPLDEIRATEREMARRLQEAKDRAAADIESARTESKRLAAEARERGREAATIRYDEAVRTAGHEAGQLRANATQQAVALRDRALPLLPQLVDAIVDLVLAPPAERGK